ncbi:MAG: UDP-N-acetylmuramoyl-L-alanine--D-glutamate ligase [Spirochaetales bacterium]|nr:UDP-N-acetylmuramoyl-L-alanine--D-glutamate ligase [Spirochaetales bacterium]
MGLGLHGGGLASALFFAARNACVTVTDLQNEDVLKPTLDKLKDYPVRFVLGRHEESDFQNADLIIKNPGVPANSPFLAIARDSDVLIETDISIFLALSNNPVMAVTGSKGKSTTASALYFSLSSMYPETKLGGNITVSPLTFLESLSPEAWVVLELSSWQLADLDTKNCLKPRVSIITNIYPDHLNRYRNMNEYVRDKKIIYALQDSEDFSIFNKDNPYTPAFQKESCAHQLLFSAQRLAAHEDGAWIQNREGIIRFRGNTYTILPETTTIAGAHNRMNLLAAGTALFCSEIDPVNISSTLAEFPGIEHRYEKVREINGISYINDSAATIPHAVVEAVKTTAGPTVLITGGTDKNIDFTPYEKIAFRPQAIVLLAGTATEKIEALLCKHKISYFGPFDNLESAVNKASSCLHDDGTVLFSPGCASFGMFLNEFDRGRQFKKIVSSM